MSRSSCRDRSLSSSFPEECRFAHLENNSFLYGWVPPFIGKPPEYLLHTYNTTSSNFYLDDFQYSRNRHNLKSVSGLRSPFIYSEDKTQYPNKPISQIYSELKSTADLSDPKNSHSKNSLNFLKPYSEQERKYAEENTFQKFKQLKASSESEKSSLEDMSNKFHSNSELLSDSQSLNKPESKKNSILSNNLSFKELFNAQDTESNPNRSDEELQKSSFSKNSAANSATRPWSASNTMDSAGNLSKKILKKKNLGSQKKAFEESSFNMIKSGSLKNRGLNLNDGKNCIKDIHSPDTVKETSENKSNRTVNNKSESRSRVLDDLNYLDNHQAKNRLNEEDVASNKSIKKRSILSKKSKFSNKDADLKKSQDFLDDNEGLFEGKNRKFAGADCYTESRPNSREITSSSFNPAFGSKGNYFLPNQAADKSSTLKKRSDSWKKEESYSRLFYSTFSTKVRNMDKQKYTYN